MNKKAGGGEAVPAVTPQIDCDAHWRAGLRQKLHELLPVVRDAYLQVFGIPDYERYLAHMSSHHPSDTVLSRRAFFERSIEHKYCRSGPRCC